MYGGVLGFGGVLVDLGAEVFGFSLFVGFYFSFLRIRFFFFGLVRSENSFVFRGFVCSCERVLVLGYGSSGR